MSADLAPGVHTVEGAIDQPGEQDRFEFVVTEKTRFLFDGVQGDQIQWQLKGSNTTDQFDYRSLTSTGDRFLDLDPGTYSLTVDGLNDKTGAYAFRLMGVEAARPLAFGDSTTGTLAAGTQAAMYSVQLEAGDRLYFQPAAGNTSGGWTLFDPGAVTVWGQNGLQSDYGPFVAQRAGTYWLSVEGQSGATSSVDYGFTMFKHAARSEALVLGQTYTATLHSPGDAASYTFDLDRATQVQWDQLSASLGNVNWVIADAKTGGAVASGALSSQDGVQSPVRLAAGSYVLRVEGAGRGQGSASFRLLTASQATEGAAEVPVSPDGNLGGQVVRIDAALSGTLSLAYAQQPGAVGVPPNAQWVITDGNGVRLGNGTLSVGQIAAVVLPRAASYYLWTNTALSGGQQGVLHVAQWSDEAPTPVVIDQVAPKTLSSNLQHSGQTLVHEITVGEGGVWAFEPTQLVEGAQWRLVGPRGTEFDWTALSASQGAAAGVRYLAPGTYRLEVRTTGLGTGVFAAAVTPFNSAAALVPGTPVDSLSNLAVGASTLLRADSVRYDDFKLAFSANGADFLVRTYDAYGRALTVSAAGAFSAGQANGAVFLRITRPSRSNETPVQISLTRTAGQAVGLGDVPDTLPRAVDVLVTSGTTVSVDVTIGDGANGIRDVDWYRVVLKAGEVLRLSTPNGTFDGYARVFNAAGAEVGRTDDSPLAYTVSSTGVYYVAISGYPNSNYDPFVEGSGNGGATGTLSFTITREVDSQPAQNDTLANAKELLVANSATSSTEVTIGEGAVGGLDVELVRVLLVAGDRLDLGVSGSDFSQHLRLFDANGVEEANATGDALSWTVGTTGVYYVGVSRATNKNYDPQTAPESSTASAGGSLTLTLVRTPVQAQAVTVKAIQPGVEVNDANSESGIPTYRFTQAADGWVALEWQAGNWTSWKLVGPRGIEANGTIREIFSSDRSRTWSAPVRWLPAGEYTLELSGGSGAARFTVNDAAHATPIAVDTTVAVDLETTDAYAVFDVVLDADVNTYLRGLAGAGADNWYRLYDAGGVLLSQGNPATTAPAVLSVPRDGHYLLVVARNTFAAGGSALRFDLATAPKAAAAIAVGDTVSGRFVTSYETRDFTFDVTTPSQLILTQNSSTGSAKTYQILDANGNAIDKIAYYGNSAWGLAAGRHTLRVQRSDYYTAPGLDDTFNLTFVADNDVRTLDVASNASLQVSTGVADGVLKMELQAGQSYWLTPAAPLDYYLTMRARVFDPSGNLVLDSTMGGGWWSAQGGVKINAAQTGTYTVVLGVWNSSSQGVTGNYAFKLRQSSLTTTALPLEGETIGTLSLGIDEARHRFTLTQPTRVWLNVAGDNYNASLVRTDVVGNGTVIGLTNINGSDLMRVIELPAGSYELLLQSTRDNPGSYRVKIGDVTNLPALTLGTTASTAVAQSQWATAWAYDGTAGQTLLVDPRATTSVSTYWQLISPSGASVASGYSYGMGDYFQRATLPETGRYVLYLHGDTSTTTARTSTMLLREYFEPTTPVAVGTQVNATIASLGNIDHYSFTLTEDTTIVLDPQGGAANLVLRGAVGTELNLGLSSPESFYVRRLAAGSYTIDVTPQNIAATPSYGFKLTRLQDIAVAHGEVTQLSGDMPAGLNLAVHSFDVVAGRTYNLDFTVPTIYPDYFRYSVVDASGRTVTGVEWTSNASVSFTASQSGPLYLVAKQYYSATAPVHFEATLRQPSSSGESLSWDVPTTASLATRNDVRDYRFTVATSGWVELQGIATSTGQATLQLISPNGTALASGSYGTGAGQIQRVYLSAGQYVVRASGASDGATVALQFTARQVPEAHRLDRLPATPRALAEDAGSQTLLLWSLDAAAGDQPPGS